VVRALTNALTQNRLHHAYLFTGTRGVGKTTIARIYAKSLNCETGITATPCGVCNACQEIDTGRFVDLIELDAASNTQVDNMRELLEGALYAPSSGRFKVYIIDEVHMLSKSAFNAMLKTLEEPPSHVKFILATTDPQKIPVTVLSRCLQFNLKQLSPGLITAHLQYVLEQEKISFELAALNLIARAAQGSMRDALSLMDQAIAFSAGTVEKAVVATMLGAIDQSYLFDLLHALHEKNGQQMLAIADSMATRSVLFDTALQELAALLHRIALAQSVPQAIAEDEPERERLLELAQSLGAEEVQLYYQIAIHGRGEINLSPDEYAGFTMTLLRMLAFKPDKEMARQVSVVQPSVVQSIEKATIINSSQAIVSVSKVEMGGMPDWTVLLAQLNVQSMALQLAKNCVLENFSDSQITLRLSQELKHSQTKMASDKLQQALSEYFAKPIKLNIVLGKGDVATPAVVEQQTKLLKQQQANDAITQDDFVIEAQRELGASLVADSIKPIQ
jgi:DNA polymerase-3 subunit gamma/tau